MKAYLIGPLSVAAAAVYAASFTIPTPTAVIHPAVPVAKPIAAQFSGTVSSMDVPGSTLSVRGATDSRTFKVATDAVVVTPANPTGKLSDLEIGDKVDVTFLKEDGGTTLTAMRIEVNGTKIAQ